MRGAHSVGNDRSAKPTLSWIIPPIQRIGAKGAVIRRWRDAAFRSAGGSPAGAADPGRQRHHAPKIVVPICTAKTSVPAGERLQSGAAMVPVCFILPSPSAAPRP